MRANNLVLRCLAEKKGNQWQALCLDLCLAAQADTFEHAKEKLESMIAEYVCEALNEDREFAGELLNRRAPARDWAKYYYFQALRRVGSIHGEVRRLFSEVLPLGVRSNNCHA